MSSSTAAPARTPELKALLVGPGAYRGRMPGWLFWLVGKIAGDRIARVPLDGNRDHHQRGAPQMPGRDSSACTRSRTRSRRWIPRWGAL